MPLDPTDIEARLRNGFAAFNKGDYDTVVKEVAPDLEFLRPGSQPLLHGAAAFRQWLEPDALEVMTTEILDLRVAEDKVLLRQRTTARGAGSGIELDVASWTVWTLNADGLAKRIELYLDHEKEDALRSWGGDPEGV